MSERGGAALRARGLGVRAPEGRGWRGLVAGVDLTLETGKSVGLVGASGSGKSTLARALVGLEARIEGSLRWGEVEVLGGGAARWGALRRAVQLCWQDPARALDPWQTAGAAIHEARGLAGREPYAADDPRLRALLAEVRLDAGLLARRPGAMSGGQRQRVALARALAAEPAILIADEVTSALDRPLAFEVVDLLKARVAAGLGLLFITHDLALLPGLVDEVVVMAGGRIVEAGGTMELLRAPRAAATRALVAALPRLPG